MSLKSACLGWLFCNVVEDKEFHMDSLVVPTSPQTNPLRPGASHSTELWEVILVASCPIIFIIFLCLCVVCLVVRSYERPSNQSSDSGASSPLHGHQSHQHRRHAAQIASILRQLPPPPKYDIAVTSVDAPPPLYSDIGKDMCPVRTTPSTSPTNQICQSPTRVQPLNIQYLYPPKYEINDPNEIKKSANSRLKNMTRVEHVILEIDGTSSA